MKISLDNIKTDIDYRELNLFESHITHELHRMSSSEFIEKYKNIDFWCDSYEKKALLISVLEFVGYTLEFEFKPIYLDFLDYQDGELSINDLSALYNNSIIAFRSNGLLYDEFGGLAGGTHYGDSLYK